MTQSNPRINALLVLYRLFERDIRVAWRRRSDVISMLFFFMIAASLFPLGLGSDPKLLHLMAPSVLWVCALLSCMLSLHRMFAADYIDGTLEQLMLTNQPLLLIVFIKVVAHWVLAGLPLLLVAPLIGLQFDLSLAELKVLAYSLLLGTPTLSFIGGIGAALTLGVRNGGVLIAVLVLPLFIPVLVFGAGAVNSVAIGMSASGGLSLLAAMFALNLVFAPLAISLALKIALE
jgi:heme exporter protein B